MISKPKGRPSKLTDTQWDEVTRRSLDGESERTLAQAFGISQPALHEGISNRRKAVKTLVGEIVKLPLSDQHSLSLLVDRENVRRRIGDKALIGAERIIDLFDARTRALDEDSTREDLGDTAAMIAVVHAAAPGAIAAPTAAPTEVAASSDAKERLRRMLGL